MNPNSSLRTVDAYRLATSAQWGGAYRQERSLTGAAEPTTRTTRNDATAGVVVPFRQRA